MRFVVLASVVVLLLVLTDAKKVVKKEAKAKVAKVVEKVVEAAPQQAAAPVEPEEVPVEAVAPPVIVRPKNLHLKLASPYEKCKAECKRQRDAEGLQEYVSNLKAELAAAEAAIAADAEAAQSQAASAEAQQTNQA